MSQQVTDLFDGGTAGFEPFSEGVSQPVRCEIRDADLPAKFFHNPLQGPGSEPVRFFAREQGRGSGSRTKVQPSAERIACNQVEWHGSFLVAFAGAYEHGSAALVQNDIAHIAQCGFFDAQSCMQHECARGPIADRDLVFEGGDNAACVLLEHVHQAVVFVVCEAAMFGGCETALFLLDAIHEFDAKHAVPGFDPHAQDAERPVT